MTRKKVIPVVLIAGALLALLLGILLWPQAKPLAEFDLPDGTTLKLMWAASGSELHFYEGSRGQRMLHVLFGKRIPAKYGGSEISFPAVHGSGSVGLKLRRYVENGYLMRPWIVGDSLVLVNATGEAVRGVRSQTHYTSTKEFGSPKALYNDMYWEFPGTAERELHFRFGMTNYPSLNVFTKDFTIRNPAH